MKTFFKFTELFVIFFILSFMFISCESDNNTSITLDLEDEEAVAEVVAKLQYEKEKYPDDKEKQKTEIYNILNNYGIDTKSERTIFAKKVQKFSYQKEFNRYLINNLKILRGE
jgi:hypothetical protein